ncbi:MAG: type II toxin-antitoxin system Phd/YefM family antitoxin [Cyanobacteria bacterium P01_A01_bin.83]
MPKYLTIDEAQKQLAELSNQLHDEPAIITRDGKPVMITFGVEQFESLMETIEIISDREFMRDLKQGIEEAKQGKTVSLEDLKTDLGLD